MEKTKEDLAIETILGEYGFDEDRKHMLKDRYNEVQNRVEAYYNVASQCTKGIWGTGWNRKTALEGAGYNARIVQLIIDREYAERLDNNGC